MPAASRVRPPATATHEPADADRSTPDTGLPGVGPAVLAKAEAHFGSRAAFMQAIEDGNVDALAGVPGIGRQKATTLIHHAGGDVPTDLFGTARVEEIFQRVRDAIAAFAATKVARNQIQLLGPLASKKERQTRAKEAMAAAKEVQSMDLETARAALGQIAPLPAPAPSFEGSMAVFVDNRADQTALKEAGLDRWIHVTSARDVNAAQSVEVAIYAYSDGGAAIERSEHTVAVPFTTDPAVLAPWSVTERFRRSRAILQAAAELSKLRGLGSPSLDALTILDAIPVRRPPIDATSLEALCQKSLERAMRDAETGLANISLTGADLMRAMRNEAPAVIREVYLEAVNRAEAEVEAETGCGEGLFTETVPPELDLEAIRDAARSSQRHRAQDQFQALAKAAEQLSHLTKGIEAELEDHIAFDVRQALGSMVLAHGLTVAKWGEGFHVEGALHLDHSPHGQRVDYRLGLDAACEADGERMALLTGANSGGKTTLLETIAQIVLMAHAGLPVPATAAIVPAVDQVHFFAQRRSLGAGAFESFLRRFFPIVHAKGRVLVLADELEAMTELEAASEIIAAFLDHLAERDALAVVATHMAPHVAPAVHAPVRIDGIEARGLDDEGRLIVDRSPRLGYIARSTPELILRRLASHGPHDLRDVFADLSERVRRRLSNDGA